MRLHLQPITFAEAAAFVKQHHRHHIPPVSWKFGVAVNAPGDPGQLKRAVQQAWSQDTAHPAYQERWADDNAALGQCAVTSLVLHKYLGGTIVKGLAQGGSHYWNRLPTGDVDLTRTQFDHETEITEVGDADAATLLGHPDTAQRYERLHDRVKDHIGRRVVGVIIVGRPVARHLDDGLTLEVTRCCTDGAKNAASMLYGAAWRAAKALGYRKLITYTMQSEPGTSLRAAGWEAVAESPGRSWNTPGRPRVDKHPLQPRIRWEAPA